MVVRAQRITLAVCVVLCLTACKVFSGSLAPSTVAALAAMLIALGFGWSVIVALFTGGLSGFAAHVTERVQQATEPVDRPFDPGTPLHPFALAQGSWFDPWAVMRWAVGWAVIALALWIIARRFRLPILHTIGTLGLNKLAAKVRRKVKSRAPST